MAQPEPVAGQVYPQGSLTGTEVPKDKDLIPVEPTTEVTAAAAGVDEFSPCHLGCL